jgi:hypothetical protein
MKVSVHLKTVVSSAAFVCVSGKLFAASGIEKLKTGEEILKNAGESLTYRNLGGMSTAIR